MIKGSLARRYAKALLQIGIEDGSIEKLEKELDAFGAAVESSPDLANLLGDPTVLAELKKAVLKDIVEKLGLSEMGRNFIALLGSKGRISAFPEIQREFLALGSCARGVRHFQEPSPPASHPLHVRKETHGAARKDCCRCGDR